MIRRTLLAAAAILTLGTGAALAQTITPSDVGSFVRDANGTPIGSLKAIEGNHAVVWIGFVNTPGNHLTTVPVSDLAACGGELVLNGVTADQLAAR